MRIFCVLFCALVIVACSPTDKVVAGRKATCNEWRDSIKPEDLVSCHLGNLGLDTVLDSLLLCFFENGDRRIICSESGNEFSFWQASETCDSEKGFCVDTIKEMPDQNCRLENIPVFVSGLTIEKSDDRYSMYGLCGDFGCSEDFRQRIESCGKKYGIDVIRR